MLVIRVGESVAALQRLPAGHQGIAECCSHLVDRMGRFGFCIHFSNPALLRLLPLVILEFCQDRVAPDRTVDALDSQRQQEVSLKARSKHAGVKQGNKHPIRMPRLVALATPLRSDRPACVTEVYEYRGERTFVIQGYGHRVECCVLLLAALLAEGQKVGKPNLAVCSDSLERERSFIENLDDRGAADVQKIGCLLGRERAGLLEDRH